MVVEEEEPEVGPRGYPHWCGHCPHHDRYHPGLPQRWYSPDSHTIKMRNLWLSGYQVPLGDMILRYALGI